LFLVRSCTGDHMKNIIISGVCVGVGFLIFLFSNGSSTASPQMLSKSQLSKSEVANGRSSVSSFGDFLGGNGRIESIVIEKDTRHFIDLMSANTEKIDDRDRIRQEVFNYSRSGNYSNTREVLRLSLQNKFISEDEYFGELAHMLGIKSLETVEVFNEIMSSKSRYGKEVAYSTMAANSGISDGMSGSEVNAVTAKLRENVPEFGGSIGDVGLSDVYRYSNWLRSIESVYNNSNDFGDFLNDHILGGLKDPREIFAVIDAGYYNQLKLAGKTEVIAFIDKNVNDYRRSYPNNQAAAIIFSKID